MVSAAFASKYSEASAAIKNARAAVAHLSGSQKTALTNRLDAADVTRVKAARIIDVVKVGTDLNTKVAALQEDISAQTLNDDTVTAFNAVSTAIGTVERSTGKVAGSPAREAVNTKYVTPAKIAKETIIFEVSRYNLQKQIDADLTANKLTDVEANFAKLDRLEVRAADIKAAGNKLYPGKYPTLDKIEAQLKANKQKLWDAYQAKLTPMVTGVSAINAKQIVVKFSAAVDAKTLKAADTSDVIKLVAGDKAENPGTVTQELSADGKTLTIKAGTGFFKGDYTVKVPFEIVKGVNGQFAAPVNQKVTVNDTTAPLVSSAKATVKASTEKIKTVTLTFDEDVTSIDNVKIDGVNYTTPDVVGNQVTIAVPDLDATKTYNVTVINAQDAAGNVKEEQVAPLSVSVDNVAPTITSVSSVGENQVKVTFNKELSAKPAISGKVGTYTANVVSDITVNPDNAKEYVVTLDKSYLFKNGNSDTVALTVAKDTIADALGNTNAADIVSIRFQRCNCSKCS